jgi:aryl-alcohol dehydrogenase-like predicted oxidoreductase
MEYRRVGRTGLQVSELCLGTMQFGWTADEETSRGVMDAFLEAGGTFIDTADIYTNWAGGHGGSYAGRSEEIIGRWVRDKGARRQVVLATKVRGRMNDGPNGEGLSRKRVIECCDDSLRRLQTDYLDLYQCHWADLNTPVEETLEAMDELRRQGKVRYIGASNYPAWRLMEALWQSDKHGYPRFDCYQPEYSLMERQLFEYEALPLCKHYGLGVIPYSPLAGGFLTGKYRCDAPKPDSVRAGGNLEKYGNERGWAVIDALDEISKAQNKTVAQTALAWMLANPVITAPIIGANSPEQLSDLTGASGYRLADDEVKRLNDATAWPRNWRPIWD